MRGWSLQEEVDLARPPLAVLSLHACHSPVGQPSSVSVAVGVVPCPAASGGVTLGKCSVRRRGVW